MKKTFTSTSPNKKTLIYISTIPATIHFFLDKQIPFLIKKGYNIILISSEGSWISLQQLKNKYNLKFYAIPFSRKISPIKDLISLLRLTVLLYTIHPQIVHYSTPKASLISSIASFFAFIPFRVYNMRGIVFANYKGLTSLILKYFECITCQLSHKVIINSKSNLSFIINSKICNPSKVNMLYKGSSHGVDAELKFNPANISKEKLLFLRKKYDISINQLIFGFVGRIEKDKGIFTLLKAWEIVNLSIQYCKLLIVGPELNSWNTLNKNILNNLKNSKDILLTGEVENVELYFSLMDIFIFPSHREGFPNAVLEASAMALPVITTDALGCIDSVIHGKTGYIFKVNDSASLAKYMLLLARNKDKREEFGRNARSWAFKNFIPDRINEDLLYLYTHRHFKNQNN